MIWIIFACRSAKVEMDTAQAPIIQDSAQVVEPSDPSTLEDIDSDGYSSDEDCDDWDPAIHPQAEEIFDHVDNNCDGIIDFDGQFSGTFTMNATAIYEGTPYSFAQSCVGELSRERGASEVLLSCAIDLSQEKADLLLGETITLEARSNVVHEQTWTSAIEIASSNGWDSNGDAIMEWSDLSQDLGAQISMEVFFSSVSLSLSLEGMFERQ